MAKVSLAGLDKAEVLAALYNASRPQGMGFLQYNPAPMTVEEARRIGPERYLDYLQGRVMKVDLSKDELETWLYDRDNGEGKAAKVINELRVSKNVNTATIQNFHKSGVRDAAAIVQQSMRTPDTIHKDDLSTVVTMGLSDVEHVLAPKVAEALDQQNVKDA